MRRNATNWGESLFNVDTCDVKRVSPPLLGWARRKKVVRPGGCSSYETSLCQTVVVTASSNSKLKFDFKSLNVLQVISRLRPQSRRKGKNKHCGDRIISPGRQIESRLLKYCQSHATPLSGMARCDLAKFKQPTVTFCLLVEIVRPWQSR